MISRDKFCQFCIKMYVVTLHLNHLDKTVQMRGHNSGSMRKKENYHPMLSLI